MSPQAANPHGFRRNSPAINRWAGLAGGKRPFNEQNLQVGVSQAVKSTVSCKSSPLGPAPDVNVGATLTKPCGLAAAGGKSAGILQK